MALKVASRGTVPPFIAMDVLRAANARAAAGEDVLHLEVGQPGTSAPRGAIERAVEALGRERLGYTDALGVQVLRERIATHYREIYGVSVDPARVAVTTGSSGGFILSFLASFEAGDRVAVAVPGYPAYRNILTALGIEPVLIRAGFDHDFHLTPEQLESLGPLDGLMLASPANPTGTVLDRDALVELVQYCDDEGIRLISDEIYHGITYGARAVSALELTDEAIVINSFSKYYSMTGWRLGWMVLPTELLRSVECLAQNLYISPPALSQLAGAAALECREELDGHVARYGTNRRVLLDALPEMGIERVAPADGAFYLYADVSDLTSSSVRFCEQLLAETGVAVTPGTDFDPVLGEASVRFSFAGPEAEIFEAAQRMRRWLVG